MAKIYADLMGSRYHEKQRIKSLCDNKMMTLAGLLLDEAVLMPESFYNQAVSRLSIDGAKLFINCNPSSPHHWFYKNVLKKLREKDGLYVHFNMEDNLSLPQDVLDRYKKNFSGVFAKRYIEGRHICSPYTEMCL